MNDIVKPLLFHPDTQLAEATALKENTILLCTLNAKYIHSSLGLRYLRANLGTLQPASAIKEFTINQRPTDIVESLLDCQPDIIGFGTYIWNIAQTTEIVALLKAVAPHITIVVGGPEVSYEYEHTEIFKRCDFLITGQADFAFRDLCINLLANDKKPSKIIDAGTPAPTALAAPYDLYDDEDIANRILYVEASRGCPFKCEFCLSALDKTATPFNLKDFLFQLDKLYVRGARQFKFVDRTFNLKAANCIEILEFFLQRLDDQLFVHFEVIPDKLPDSLKAVLSQFPAGALQFEVGIQSFNSEVQQAISRKQDTRKTIDNLRWLRTNTNAYIHADLIAGLPGESLDSFARGFNQLVALQPHEIQVGILKRLRGTDVIRHTAAYNMRYADSAPYQLLQNCDLDFSTMQNIQRFARYWDLIGNSARFCQTLPLLLGTQPFERFWMLSDWIYRSFQQTHKISQKRLFSIIYQGALELSLCEEPQLHRALARDFGQSGEKGQPPWLQQEKATERNAAASHAKRQSRHSKVSAA